jgi:oligosaccharide repeat unit polymerase
MIVPLGSKKEKKASAPTAAAWILLTVSLLFSLGSAMMLWDTSIPTRSWPTYVSIAAITWMGCYALTVWSCDRHLYTFANAYVLVLSIFHLGLIIPAGLGWIHVDLGFQIGPWLARAGWCAVLALACFGVGVSLARIRLPRNAHVHPLKERPKKDKSILRQTFLDGIGLLIFSFFLFAYAWYSYGNLLKYTRADFYHGVAGADPRGLGVFLMVFPSALLMLVIGAANAREKAAAWLIVLVGMVVLLFSGYRSAALFPLLAGIIIWVKTGRRFSAITALLSLLAVLYLIPTIGHLRSTGAYEKIGTASIAASFKEAGMDKAFIEMGGTAGVLAHIIRLVPREDSYRYGATYLKAIIEGFPNLTLKLGRSEREMNPSLAKRGDSAESLKPAQWITYRVAPEKFEKGEGVGFSGIGEAYLNFGFFGVMLFFILLGYALARIDLEELVYRPNLMLFATAMFWPLLKTVRNDSVNFFKPAIFTLIAVLAWRLVLLVLTKRKPIRKISLRRKLG